MSTKNKNENKPMPSLMRKTKAQLVDIILRKDNIECGLRNDIKGMDNNLNKYKEKLANITRQLDSTKHAYEMLRANFESSCDENTSTICELREIIKHNNSVILKLYIGLIISIVVILCLCCL